MFKLLKNLFSSKKLKEETRFISNESSNVDIPRISGEEANQYLAGWILFLMNTSQVKRYKRLLQFVNKYRETAVELTQLYPVDIEPTEEIRSICNMFITLKYKCDNKEFLEFVYKVRKNENTECIEKIH
jgi:hypothetical protein